jgi:imidazolonepropionase-like amidohydrolase
VAYNKEKHLQTKRHSVERRVPFCFLLLFIKNRHLKTMAGDDIQNGCLLIDDNGKIKYIGENIEAPADAEVIHAQGMLVTPGCVEAHCHIGLGDLSAVIATSPHLR